MVDCVRQDLGNIRRNRAKVNEEQARKIFTGVRQAMRQAIVVCQETSSILWRVVCRLVVMALRYLENKLKNVGKYPLVLIEVLRLTKNLLASDEMYTIQLLFIDSLACNVTVILAVIAALFGYYCPGGDSQLKMLLFSRSQNKIK